MLWATSIDIAEEYRYPTMPIRYEMSVDLEGDLPILGWRKGSAGVEVEFEVVGLPGRDGLQRAKHRLLRFKSTMNGANLPFGLENAKEFFPETTVDYLPNGRVAWSNAPQRELPATLPGLDARRFPEMSYLPIEFEHGRFEWKFERSMGSGPMTFAVQRKEDSPRSCAFKAHQQTKHFEDAKSKKIEAADEATYVVESIVEGMGTASMHAERPILHRLELDAQTTTRTTNKKGGGEVVQRRWSTRVRVRLIDSLSP